MKVEFFFDPSCPWCWVTSRWLLLVSGKRDISITWRPFSLAIKNDELDSGNDSGAGEHHRASHRILRVALAAEATGKISLIDVYTAFGIPYHAGGFAYDDELIRDTLADKGLAASLLAAADDTSYDEVIRASMDAALDVTGQDVGVPIIVFVDGNGNRRGYFGPVLDALPDDDEALRIWDGLSAMATSSHFYELKRSRAGVTTPDIASTARC